MPRLALSLLGPFQARVGERAIADFATDKVRALLAYLAVEADRPHRRDTLAALLWPNWDDAAARSNLRLTLHRMREALDAGTPSLSDAVFGVTRETVQINGAAVDVDVARFVSLMEMCELHPHRLLHLCPSCLAQLVEAAALYEGELLAGLSIADAPGFEQWELARRAELEQRVMTLFYRLADAFEQLGDYERGLLFAHRQLALDPYREEAHRQVMRLYARQGERAAAMAHFERARRLLAEELGVNPDPATTALIEEVRQGKLSAEHAGRPQRYHFPAQFTPFFGRDDEIVRLVERLSDPSGRLLTIVAPGGMGKTRLAIAATEALAEQPGFPDGIFFLPLARTADADLLPSALAGALGLNLAGAAEPAQQLAHYLRARRALIVLDNFEHLLDGIDLLLMLLEEAPDVRWLVTSRVALNVRAEERFSLGGLSVDNATQLFAATAARVAPGYVPNDADRTAVGDICRAVGGMPLAVELAATWVRLMDAPAIAAQIGRDLDFLTTTLRDLPPRQRSMRAVLDGMWAYLSPPEVAALASLSVMRGPFQLDAAAAISHASPLVLAQLLDQSLLRPADSGRFEMHELLRQYAVERLASSPEAEAAAHEDHGGHYLALLIDRGAALGGAESKVALADLRRNLDNVRAAWAWTSENGRYEVVGNATRSLETFYRYSGLLAEGVETLALAATALEAHITRGQLDPDVAYPIVYGLWRREALLLELMGRSTSALARLEHVRDGWEAHGDQRRMARTLNDMGYVHARHARYDAINALSQAALRLGRELGDEEVVADALHNLGNASNHMGELDKGIDLLRESIVRYHVVGGGRWLAGALCDLGMAYAFKGELDAAHESIVQGLAVAEAAGDKPGIAHALTMLGGVTLNMGNMAATEEYSRRALTDAQEIGDNIILSVCLVNLGHVAQSRREPAARQLYRECAALSLEIDHASILAEALTGLAMVAAGRDPQSGARWLEAVATWRESTQFISEEPFVRALRQEAEAQVRAALGDRFAAVWADGKAMTLETAAAQAIAWADEAAYRL